MFLSSTILCNRHVFFFSSSVRSKSTHRASTLVDPTLLDHPLLSDSPQAQSSARAHIDYLLTHPTQFKDTLLPFARLSFSTSGGKGGQNVNKVNTKATLRLDLGKLRSIIPAYWITNLSNSHLYAPQTGQLVIQSSLTRSQASNVDDCWSKLLQSFHSASQAGLVGATSAEQSNKVQRLKSIDKSRTRKIKSIRKDIKSNRSKPIF